MKADKKQSARGGAREGAGRKPKRGWLRRPLSLRDSTWKKLKRERARRKKSGAKNASMTEIADELIFFGLEDDKRAALEAIARERGVSVDELVSEAVAAFLKEQRDLEERRKLEKL